LAANKNDYNLIFTLINNVLVTHFNAGTNHVIQHLWTIGPHLDKSIEDAAGRDQHMESNTTATGRNTP